MAPKELLLAIGMIVATLQPTVANNEQPLTIAPPGTPDTRYCLRVDPITGTRLETIQCRTRDDWAALGVDVDQEWADNGVRVIA
jgi:hypothetical protein